MSQITTTSRDLENNSNRVLLIKPVVAPWSVYDEAVGAAYRKRLDAARRSVVRRADVDSKRRVDFGTKNSKKK